MIKIISDVMTARRAVVHQLRLKTQVQKLIADPRLRKQTYRIASGSIGFSAVRCESKPVAQLVMIHGSPGDWRAFAPYLLSEHLREKFDLVSVDRLGYGASARKLAEPSLESQAMAFTELIQGTELPTLVVGHSHGGPVAAQLALEFPKRVVGLVSLAGCFDPELETPQWYQWLANLTPVRTLLPQNLITSNDEMIPLKDELTKLKPGLRELLCPATFIHGTFDTVVDVKNLDYVTQVLPHAKILRVNDMDHFLPWTHQALIENQIFEVLRN